MKKTWTIVLLCAMLAGSLAACGGTETETKKPVSSGDTENETVTETESETEPV